MKTKVKNRSPAQKIGLFKQILKMIFFLKLIINN